MASNNGWRIPMSDRNPMLVSYSQSTMTWLIPAELWTCGSKKSDSLSTAQGLEVTSLRYERRVNAFLVEVSAPDSCPSSKSEIALLVALSQEAQRAEQRKWWSSMRTIQRSSTSSIGKPAKNAKLAQWTGDQTASSPHRGKVKQYGPYRVRILTTP